MSARCTTRMGKRTCHTPLTITTNGFGRTFAQCPRCTWRAQGRCWACGAPRTNHPVMGIYCAPCRKDAAKASYTAQRRTEESKAKVSAYWKARRADPTWVEKKRAYLKQWKAKNPDKVKANWQRYLAKREHGKAA